MKGATWVHAFQRSSTTCFVSKYSREQWLRRGKRLAPPPPPSPAPASVTQLYFAHFCRTCSNYSENFVTTTGYLLHFWRRSSKNPEIFEHWVLLLPICIMFFLLTNPTFGKLKMKCAVFSEKILRTLQLSAVSDLPPPPFEGCAAAIK